MESHSAPRVLLVEDDQWIRQSFEATLGWRGVGLTHAASASTGKAAISLLEQGLEADVALVDIGLPDVHGTAVIRACRELRPACVCVVFTIFDDQHTIMRAIRAGAQGYLLKETPVNNLLEGLRDAAAGGAPMSSSVARFVLNELREHQTQNQRDDLGLEALTVREKEVLSLLARGLSYPEIAASLGIKLGTVQGYVKKVYSKLQVDSKAEAATLAQRVGLV